MMDARRISDDELNAYVDGWLGGEDRLAVERRMAEDPETAGKVEAYRLQNVLLHELFDPSLNETPPANAATLATVAALTEKLAGRVAANDQGMARWASRRWVRYAGAAMVLTMIGVAGGWTGRDLLTPPAAPPVEAAAQPATTMQSFAAEAAEAHRIYTAEDASVRGEEMKADDPGALNSFLSERMGRPVQGPDLATNGYRLTGGRTLPTELGPGAQFVYAGKDGKRVTLLVGPAQQGKDGAYSFAQQGDMAGFYWVDGGLAYALFGHQSREELMDLTKAIQANLKVRRAPTAKPAEPASQQPPESGDKNAPTLQPVSDARPKAS